MSTLEAQQKTDSKAIVFLYTNHEQAEEETGKWRCGSSGRAPTLQM
jgi:hypothetical protein